MTQERTAKISIIIEEEVIERGSDFLVKDIQYLKRTSPTTVEIGLVMSKGNHYEQFTLNIDKKLIQNIFDQSNKVLGLTTQQLKKIHSDDLPFIIKNIRSIVHNKRGYFYLCFHMEVNAFSSYQSFILSVKFFTEVSEPNIKKSTETHEPLMYF